jgi:hypothetical protein
MIAAVVMLSHTHTRVHTHTHTHTHTQTHVMMQDDTTAYVHRRPGQDSPAELLHGLNKYHFDKLYDLN